MPPTVENEILIVDDDADIRQALEEVLSDEGYAVSTAANGLEALGHLAATRDRPPKLILLDLMMPIMDGFSFLDRYGGDPSLPAVPVIVLSANGSAAARLSRSDVLCYLPKPVDLNRLLETIEQS